MRLYLFRHGLAVEPGTPDIADDDRPLVARGRRLARRVARGLGRVGPLPEVVVTSPLPRAFETAEIAACAWHQAVPVETADVLRPESDPVAIRTWLARRPEGVIMLVGHNPNLSQLLSGLVGGARVELRKAGLAALEGDVPNFRLDWLARPKIFRRP